LTTETEKSVCGREFRRMKMSILDENEWDQLLREFDRLIGSEPGQWVSLLQASRLSAQSQTVCLAMLKGHGETGLLDKAPRETATDPATLLTRSLAEGSQIGDFKIGRLLGRGGMSEVFEAVRTSDDFEQRVALKVLRIDAAGEASTFKREAQVLTTLDHPNIARFIDAGVTDDKRPYLVMDLVDGVPITDWCARQNSSLRDRLQLICEVCDAVSYAHGKLVIHRDVKPANILVTPEGRIRLLDFGIARLLQQAVPGDTLTRAMATPLYAAPEQFEQGYETVATDVYALGVLLCELTAGISPWDSGSGNMRTIMRRILFADPLRPSQLARLSNIPPKALTGDIDAIALRAMSRAPADRYPSVAEFRSEIDRHLRFIPVRARSGAFAYSARRFLRRRRWAVAGAVSAVISLSALAAGAMFQARETAIERDAALAASQRSAAVTQALTVMFRDARGRAPIDQISVREMLDETAGRLAASLEDNAESVELLVTFADLYVMIEEPLAIEPFLEKALSRGIGNHDDLQRGRLSYRLAACKNAIGKPDEAKALLAPAIAAFNANPDAYRRDRLDSRSVEASLARAAGDTERAAAIALEDMAESEIEFATDPREILTRYNNLLIYLLQLNRLSEVAAVLDRADVAVEKFGQRNTQLGFPIRQARALYLGRMGDTPAAERALEQLMADRLKLEGQSIGYAMGLLQVARMEITQEKYTEAMDHLNIARPVVLEKIGPASPPAVFLDIALAEALAASGNRPDADILFASIETRLADQPTPPMIKGVAQRLKAIWAFEDGRRAEARISYEVAKAHFAEAKAEGVPLLEELEKTWLRLASEQAAP
jgi:eukaryotic-like serine/threonine-protein kinase